MNEKTLNEHFKHFDTANVKFLGLKEGRNRVNAVAIWRKVCYGLFSLRETIKEVDAILQQPGIVICLDRRQYDLLDGIFDMVFQPEDQLGNCQPEIFEMLFSVKGVVEKLVNGFSCTGYAQVCLFQPDGERRTIMTREDLRPSESYRRGAWFEIQVVRSSRSVKTNILGRPDLENNEFRKKAQEIDLSFLDEKQDSK